MANLFFPQLASGALAQYPLRKTRSARTIRNILPSGDTILNADQSAAEIVWQLGYSCLSATDLNVLVNFFAACQGRFHGFTFIDPTDNMLANTASLTSVPWTLASQLQVTGGAADPAGGQGAFLATNNAQLYGEISQALVVPADYQYCFSVYAQSATPATITLVRRGTNGEETTSAAVGPKWTRLISTGQLADTGTTFSVAIGLAAGQQVSLYGPQLEGQRAPSRFRSTLQTGGVYANAHWGVDDLPVSADGPNLYSTVFSIETTV
ncbi:MAG TPA: DUF2460 domain-containing protein [Bryobacteraceae bacterium]|nr:DUF2460 domain-containing protein [Bryobacteraceae bacterium]